ncbi:MULTISPECIES: hypothetical protein [Bacillus]|nr:hypothetical protein [Bacillus paramycoides]
MAKKYLISIVVALVIILSSSSDKEQVMPEAVIPSRVELVRYQEEEEESL